MTRVKCYTVLPVGILSQKTKVYLILLKIWICGQKQTSLAQGKAETVRKSDRDVEVKEEKIDKHINREIDVETGRDKRRDRQTDK